MEWQARRGPFWQGQAWQAGHGTARRGAARYGRRGMAWRGAVRDGGARHGRHGSARQGAARRGEAGTGRKNSKRSVNMSNNKILGIKKELEQIRKTHKGFLRPEDVVEYARNQNTELHGMFCWDDTEAAHKYRVQQAGYLIRSIKVQIRPNPKQEKIVTVREYVSLPAERGAGGYRQINEVLTDDDLRLQFIESVQAEFAAFREKLKAISEIAYKKSEVVKTAIERERMETVKRLQKNSRKSE